MMKPSIGFIGFIGLGLAGGAMVAHALEGDPTKLAFSIRNAAKDVGYYARMAADAGAPSVMANGPPGALRDAIEKGAGDAMVPELVDYFATRLRGG